jgi:serine/threonine protein kinase
MAESGTMREIVEGTRGSYEILGELGGGGMCIVYRGMVLESGQEVAIKALQERFSTSKEICAKFLRGAEVHAELSLHQNVVNLVDYFDQQSRPYVVMELVEGGSLENRLKERGLMPYQRAIPIFLQILSAIEHAHQKKIVHRDIKPSNILLSLDNIPKVTDFDIGKRIGGETFTKFGQRLGTRPYMSPEQTLNALGVAEASDIYSLGVTLYEMCTNRVPFEAEDVIELYEMIQNEPPIPPREVYPFLPLELERIILKAMEKEQDDRFDSVTDFRNALVEFTSGLDLAISHPLGGETVLDPTEPLEDPGSSQEIEQFGSLVQVNGEGPIFPVTKQGVRMGRGKPNAIVIPEDDLRISRNHAWVVPLTMERGRVVIIDLGSKNGTFVNGFRLDPSYRIELAEGDVIQLGHQGDWRFVFQERPDDQGMAPKVTDDVP